LGFSRELVDTSNIDIDFEVGIIRSGQGQGRPAKIDFVFATVDGLTEFFVRIAAQITVT
jgi:hypothetical protein